jgi:hypothetical protein
MPFSASMRVLAAKRRPSSWSSSWYAVDVVLEPHLVVRGTTALRGDTAMRGDGIRPE